MAAVVGREFAIGALEHASERGRGRLLALLDEAEAARVIAEVPAVMGRYRFTHALIRETLYEQLTAALRVRLHRRVGDSLEVVYAADMDPHLSEVAHHFPRRLHSATSIRPSTTRGERQNKPALDRPTRKPPAATSKLCAHWS